MQSATFHPSYRALLSALVLASVGVCWGDADAVKTAAIDVSATSIQDLLNANVVSASLHKQGTGDAPARVTVITDRDIARFGYRTLAEALDSVPGFYISTDHIYSYLGARGISSPGDSGTRFLLLINGRSIGDPAYSVAGVLGQEFGIEMSLIKQIEVIHGPASALYGSNAALCTINVVTKRPAEMPNVTAEAEAGSLGEKKLHLAYSGEWHGVNAMISGAVFNDSGPHSIYFPEFDSISTNFGHAVDMNGERGYHLFGIVDWGHWQFSGMFSDRDEVTPLSYGDTIFNDRGTRVNDNLGFVDADYKRSWRRTDLEWRTAYSSYRYEGLYHYLLPDDTIEDNRETDTVRWISSQLIFRVDGGRFGTTTMGTDVAFDLRANFSNYDVQPLPASYVNLDELGNNFGFFAQQEFSLFSQWKAVIGGRGDVSPGRQSSVAPRAALIWQPSHSTSLKLLYGRSFRNPNTYELFYSDGISQTGNATLHPEKGDTFEVVGEKWFPRGIRVTASVYRMNLHSVIVMGQTESGLFQYQNVSGTRVLGGEGELGGRLKGNLDFSASIAVENAVEANSRGPLPNSPRQIAKIHLSRPFFRNHGIVAGAVNWAGRRNTISQLSLPGALKADVTFTTKRLTRQFDLQTGVRNLMDRRILDPIALGTQVDAMPENGRSFFVRLIWNKQE